MASGNIGVFPQHLWVQRRDHTRHKFKNLFRRETCACEPQSPFDLHVRITLLQLNDEAFANTVQRSTVGGASGIQK